MARSRTLRPSFFSSFSLAKVCRDARLTFTGLWVEADDDGRLIDSPKHLAGAIFPHDDDVTADMLKGWLDELEKIEAIHRYETPRGRYIVIVNWSEHQKPPHPTPSKLPTPPGSPGGLSDSRDSHEDSANLSRAGHEHDAPVSRDAHSLGLGFGSGLGSGLCSGSGQGLGSGPSADVAGNTDEVLRTEGKGEGKTRKLRLAVLSKRLAGVCEYPNVDATMIEAANVVAWALKHVDWRLVDEAIGWAESVKDPKSPFRYPRVIANLIRSKANGKGISMPEYDANVFHVDFSRTA